MKMKMEKMKEKERLDRVEEIEMKYQVQDEEVEKLQRIGNQFREIQQMIEKEKL